MQLVVIRIGPLKDCLLYTSCACCVCGVYASKVNKAITIVVMRIAYSVIVNIEPKN